MKITILFENWLKYLTLANQLSEYKSERGIVATG
ncbi:MAG: hypothetical protein ACJAU2_001285 [Maribacter sp.]|jgi:hypothetical protein